MDLGEKISQASWKVFAQDANGNTLLHLAVLQNRPDCVEKLLPFEILATLRNEAHFTPVELAQFLNRKDCLAFLAPPPNNHFFQCGISLEHFCQEEQFEWLHVPFFSSYKQLLLFSRHSRKTKNDLAQSERMQWLHSLYSKQLENPTLPQMSVRWVDETVGFGLFAEREVEKGTFIGEYVGEIRKSHLWSPPANQYCFQHLKNHFWEFPYMVDAEKKGNHTRYINHSESANCEIFPVFFQGILRLLARTTKDVKLGEELTLDYGPRFWRKRQKKDRVPANV